MRILRAKQRLGLFSDPYRARTPPANAELRALARRVAGESIVLLRNERSLLPLPKTGPIAVIGPLADNKEEPLGPWHTQGRAEDVVSVLQGIKAKVPGGTQVLYAQGAGIEDTATSGFAAAVTAAKQAKVAVLVLGERGDMSGEAASRSDLGLPGVQQRLLEAVEATGTPVVLVLMNGRPLILPWASDHVPAIVETWFLGIESGNATADVLFGDVNPSGRLPVTFPRVLGQVPIYYNRRNTGRPADANNKYTAKYIDAPVTPRYPFGFGLSYTTFSYSNLKLSAARARVSDTVTATVTVTNTGSREGTEVVQLYVRDMVASVSRPLRELKAFRRVTLKPGESKAIDLPIAVKDLWFIGLDMKPVVEPGTFRVYVGPNSAEGQEATFDCMP
jgi:beta-glucosidase